MSESPSGKREGFQDNATLKKGKFITDSSQGSCRNFCRLLFKLRHLQAFQLSLDMFPLFR